MPDQTNLLAVANTFLASYLGADSALVALVSTRFKADFILPAGTTTFDPLVSFNFMAGSNILMLGGRRIYTNCVYQVMGHAPGGYGVVGPIADRIVAVLGNVSGALVSYGGTDYQVDCFAIGEIQLRPEVIQGGQVIYARGSKVRIYIGVPG
jgi:hypothetical protein